MLGASRSTHLYSVVTAVISEAPHWLLTQFRSVLNFEQGFTAMSSSTASFSPS